MARTKFIQSTDPRLGRHVNHDPRSRSFAFTAPATGLVSVHHGRFIEVFDQGNVGSCTGNAGIGNMGTHPFYNTLVESVTDWTERAAVSLYSDATKIDNFDGTYPPHDTGSDGLSVAKVLHRRGWISGYQHAFSLDAMKAALQKGPVIVGINWYNNFFTPDSEGHVSIAKNDSVAGGHEIVCDEIDVERGRFGFTNSWGQGWGLDGRFYISFDLMDRLLKEDGDVTIMVPSNQPAPAPSPSGKSWFARLLEWFAGLFS